MSCPRPWATPVTNTTGRRPISRLRSCTRPSTSCRGTETWYSSGKGKDGRISTPPISDVYPEWFLLVWDEPHTVRSVWVHGNARQWSLEQYVGPDSINPRVGTPREWRKVKDFSEQSGGGRWIVLDKPLTTRGLRLNITKVDGQAADRLDRRVPRARGPGCPAGANWRRSAGGGKRPPFEIPLDLASEDNLTMVVNDASGKPRAQPGRPRAGGQRQATVPWDLKDEAAGYVTPGKYTWQAITCPTLQPRYEFTVYPNVSENCAGKSALAHRRQWSRRLAGRPLQQQRRLRGRRPRVSGGLHGRKRRGPDRVQSGRPQALGAPRLCRLDRRGPTGQRRQDAIQCRQINGRQTENVWAIDIETKQIRPLMSLQPTSQRNRGFAGIAARDGEVILSVSAPGSWLAGAAAADDVDLAACYPLYPPPRKPKVAYEPIPNPAE